MHPAGAASVPDCSARRPSISDSTYAHRWVINPSAVAADRSCDPSCPTLSLKLLAITGRESNRRRRSFNAGESPGDTEKVREQAANLIHRFVSRFRRNIEQDRSSDDGSRSILLAVATSTDRQFARSFPSRRSTRPASLSSDAGARCLPAAAPCQGNANPRNDQDRLIASQAASISRAEFHSWLIRRSDDGSPLHRDNFAAPFLYSPARLGFARLRSAPPERRGPIKCLGYVKDTS